MSNFASSPTPDATSTVKGKLQLAGDLGGTAASPTVPGLTGKADLVSPTFTGTVGGVTAAMVGLGSVPNTDFTSAVAANTAKVSFDSTSSTRLANTSGSNTGDQNLSTYAPLASPALTGVPTAPTAAVSTNTTQLATTAFVLANGGSTPDATTIVKGKAYLGAATGSATFESDALKAPLASPTFTGTVGGITAAMVGAPSGSGTSSGTNTGDNTVATALTGAPNITVGNITGGNSMAITGGSTGNMTILSGTGSSQSMILQVAKSNGTTGTAATLTDGTVTATTFVGALTGTASGNLVSGGALGTPSSGTLTNVSGTAANLTAGHVTTNANLTGDVTSSGNATTLAAAARLFSKVKTITRDMSTATGDVAYTGVGFTPTSLIGIGAVTGGLTFGVGVADSAKAGSEIESYAANTMQQTNTSFLKFAVSAGNDQAATVKTYDADGFTLTWTKTGTPTGSIAIAVLCFR